jgi:PAS domain S-box-containing protein
MTTETHQQQTRVALVNSEHRVLERIASGAPLGEILETLVRLVEEQAQGMRCAVLLVDVEQQRLRFAAAPNIPTDYKAGIDPFLRIAPNMGACGTAAFLRKPVYTKDTGIDALWEDCRDIAVRNGLRAIWSTPIISDDNGVLGTFAMYYGEPRLPSTDHIQLIDMATQMARVAIEARRDEELLRTIFKSAPSGMAITDLAGNIVRVNPAFARLVGYTEAELLGRTIADLTHEDDTPQDTTLIDELLCGKREHFVIDKRHRRKDGKVIWGHHTVVLLRGSVDEPSYIVALVENITERKQAQDELQRSAAELQALSLRLVEVQESERRELSRELHDRIGRNLTALGINLEILRTQSAGDQFAIFQSRLQDSKALVESTADAIQDVMTELHPPMLDEHGLRCALDWYAKEFANRTGISAAVQGDGLTVRGSPQADTAFFRIAQEALNNVAKHARATHIDIGLEHSATERIMSVLDNGSGIDALPSSTKRSNGGRGMAAMRERARAVGGQLEVHAIPGGGTRVVVRIPR